MKSTQFAQIAIDTPLRTVFDYKVAATMPELAIGARVLVPFGKRRVVGIVLRQPSSSHIASTALRSILEVIDSEPLLDPLTLGLIEWAAAYYQCPIGVAVFSALPPALRKTKAANIESNLITYYMAQDLAQDTDQAISSRAWKQQAIYQWLLTQTNGASRHEFEQQFPDSLASLKRLQELQIVVSEQRVQETATITATTTIETTQLNAEQQFASEQIQQDLSCYKAHLLEGVTGSGKTEVYFAVIRKILEQADSQVLLVVPEIGLAPQLLARIRNQFNVSVGILHSNISERERKETWLNIRAGKINIILGTRLAIFAPIPNLKLIIVDEEHDASFKQQEGFMYNARDLAIYRARLHNIPIILGSATPSFESIHNVQQKKYQHLTLRERAHSATIPSMQLVDMRQEKSAYILSSVLRQKMQAHLKQGKQVILFLNRRGYAPALICHACGWTAQCSRCDANMTLHVPQQKMICHHCERTTAIPTSCADCSYETLLPIGHGTQRVEEVLAEEFSNYSYIRLDRDVSQKKGMLEDAFSAIKNKQHQIILGTQLLSKGHDFPEVTLVGVLDIDYGIYSTDFRALEKTAQLLIQVAGRSGRRQQRGEVIVQTHAPDHPMLTTLLNAGYTKFSELALTLRKDLGLPPYQHQIALRVRSQTLQSTFAFLHAAKQLAPNCFTQDVSIMGPMAAVMEKKAGQHRAYIMLTGKQRGQLGSSLSSWLAQIEKLPQARKVRWTIDVDPIDNF